jgi:hypothetical protein
VGFTVDKNHLSNVAAWASKGSFSFPSLMGRGRDCSEPLVSDRLLGPSIPVYTSLTRESARRV